MKAQKNEKQFVFFPRKQCLLHNAASYASMQLHSQNLFVALIVLWKVAMHLPGYT